MSKSTIKMEVIPYKMKVLGKQTKDEKTWGKYYKDGLKNKKQNKSIVKTHNSNLYKIKLTLMEKTQLQNLEVLPIELNKKKCHVHPPTWKKKVRQTFENHN